jgi:hypothetical protein
MKWGLSVADWRDHVVDDHGDHPGGSLQARCGHWMMVVTPLRDTLCGKQCEACAIAVAGAASPP